MSLCETCVGFVLKTGITRWTRRQRHTCMKECCCLDMPPSVCCCKACIVLFQAASMRQSMAAPMMTSTYFNFCSFQPKNLMEHQELEKQYLYPLFSKEHTCHVLSHCLGTIISYAVGVNHQTFQSVVVFQGFKHLGDAHLSNAVLPKICCHAPTH